MDALELLLEFFSDLSLRMRVEDFMRKLLQVAVKLIPSFDKGSVVMRKDGKWKYVAWIGFPDEIAEIDFEDGELVLPETEEPIVIEDIMDSAVGKIPDWKLKKFEKLGSSSIKKTISVAIKIGDEVIGGFYIDSFKDVHPSEEDLRLVKAFGKLASIFIAMKLYQERERGYQKEIIFAMVKAMEARDPYTVGHSERVALYAVAIAKRMELDVETVDRIYWGSIVHDIGKLAVPEFILLKPSGLTEAEYEIVKRHPVAGENMIKDYPWLSGIRKIVRNHHERCDGMGYPDGLTCDRIPLEVKIVSVADSFDAMTSDRAYRKGLPLETALNEIEFQSGKQFDPEIVEVAVEVLREEYEKLKSIKKTG